jgi:hypothetical protein
MTLFNCPEWGIGIDSIRFFSLFGRHPSVVAFISDLATSCDSLVVICLQVPHTEYSSAQLQFILLPSSQSMSVAEVQFFTHGDCPIGTNVQTGTGTDMMSVETDMMSVETDMMSVETDITQVSMNGKRSHQVIVILSGQ